VLDEVGEQLRIGPGRLILKAHGLANLLNPRIHAVGCHDFPRATSVAATYLYTSRSSLISSTFSFVISR
jgi:hypothetical protein